MHAAAQNIVRALLRHIKSSSPKPGSFASLLLAAKHSATGRPLSDAQMFPEIAALFFAGIDTTGHTGTRPLLCVPFVCGP
jgi:cytochrome P450